MKRKIRDIERIAAGPVELAKPRSTLHIAIFLSLLMPSAAFGQEEHTLGPAPLVLKAEGVDLFKWVLQKNGFQPATYQQVIENPKRGLFVVMGRVEIGRHEIGKIGEFVGNGGALLTACDAVNGEFGLGFRSSGRVVASQLENCYLNNSDFPFVKPVGPEFSHPGSDCFREADKRPLQKIVLNRPSSLRLFGPKGKVKSSTPSPSPSISNSLTPLAAFHDHSDFRVEHFPRPGSPNRVDPLEDFFAVGMEYKRGDAKSRVLALGDYGVFRNQLLIRPNIDNMKFAGNVVEWLAGSGIGKRDLCAFFYDGEMQSSFDLKIPEMPLPPLDQLANAVLSSSNSVVDSLQKDDFFNKFLLDQFGRNRVLRTISIVLAFLLLSWILWRLWTSRTALARGRIERRQESEPDLLDPVSQIHLQSDQGDYFPMARSLVRSSFFRLGEMSPAGKLSNRQQLARLLPWYAARRRGILKRLWPIGFGKKPQVIPPKALRTLLEDLQDLEAFLERRRLAALPSATGHLPQKA